MDTNITPAIDRLLKAGAEATGIEITSITNRAYTTGLPDTIPVAIKHGANPSLESVNRLFEEWRERPATKRGTAETLTLQSFIDLTNRHKTAHSAIFANTNWQTPKLTAVIDYHGVDIAHTYDDADGQPTTSVEEGLPDNLKHRIAYAYPLSDDWKIWTKLNGEVMDQGKFAAFIEDRIADLASPFETEKMLYEANFQTTFATPAQLIQLSRGLEVNVEAKRKSLVTLQSGAGQLVFEETHKDADGKPLIIPGLFILSIAPFIGGEKVRIPVRLRYRPAGDKVVWFYQIYRPDLAIMERVGADLVIVRRDTALPVYEGSPEV